MYSYLSLRIPSLFPSRLSKIDPLEKEQRGVTSGCKHSIGNPTLTDPSYRSDWTADLTHPRVDANEGWQYAHSFDDAEDQWSAEPPPSLERLLSGSGIMTAGLGASSSRSGSSTRAPATQAWVRRRRWVRVMRRRLDIPPLPYLAPDGLMYQLTNDGKLVLFVSEPQEEAYGVDGHELGAMPASFLSMSHDYVARSRYLAGTPSAADPTVSSVPPVEVRRSIAKLERAVMELRMGMLGKWKFVPLLARLIFPKVMRIMNVERRRKCCSMLTAAS